MVEQKQPQHDILSETLSSILSQEVSDDAAGEWESWDLFSFDADTSLLGCADQDHTNGKATGASAGGSVDLRSTHVHQDAENAALHGRQDEDQEIDALQQNMSAEYQKETNSTVRLEKVQQKKRDQNKSRKRQQEELQHLRVHVKELKLQVEQLLNDHMSKRQVPGATEMQESDATCRSSSRRIQLPVKLYFHRILFLKRSASRAKKDAEKAVLENARLRSLIEAHHQVIESLKTVIERHRAPTAADLAFVNVNLQPSLARCSGLDDLFDPPSVFELLGEGLDAQYQRLDAIWDSCGFAASSLKCNHKENEQVPINIDDRVKRNDEGNIFLESVRSQILPFPLDAVTRAIWKCLNQGTLAPMDCEIKTRKAWENTLHITLRGSFQALHHPASPDPNAAADITTQTVTRAVFKQFVDADRVVFVWAACFEIEDGALSASVRLYEQGWSVLRGHPRGSPSDHSADGNSTAKTAACFTQTCTRVTPEVSNKGELSEEDFATDAVLNQNYTYYCRNRRVMQQIAENLFIDESLHVCVEPHPEGDVHCA